MPIDPQMQALLDESVAAGTPALNTLSVAEARAQPNLGASDEVPLDPVTAVVERGIPGPAGSIRIRVYTPAGSAPFPVLLYIHGGGWVVCSLDTHDRECRTLARGAGCLVVSVDYRLAPEHKFPAAVDDCLAALRWVLAHAAEIGGDPRRVAIGGDSAGGNLAAAITILARDQGLGPLAGQLLIYPVTDHYDPGTPSYREFGEGCGLTRDSMIWFWDHYLSHPGAAGDPRAAPLRAPDLRGLPPAFVLTAEYDVLRDEGERYAERLRAAGLPTRLKRYDGAIHGFVNMSAVVDLGRLGLADSIAWLREIFA